MQPGNYEEVRKRNRERECVSAYTNEKERERERYIVYLSTSTDDIEDKYFLSNKHFSELTKRPSTKSSNGECAHTPWPYLLFKAASNTIKIDKL